MTELLAPEAFRARQAELKERIRRKRAMRQSVVGDMAKLKSLVHDQLRAELAAEKAERNAARRTDARQLDAFAEVGP